jgi:hypothetical protein
MEVVRFKKLSGLRVNGREPLEEPKDFLSSHFSRASWLTARVESGAMFGTVINYDGTGMTAGIHQAIAVYPKALEDSNKENDQGPLWELLTKLEETWSALSIKPINPKERSWPVFESYLSSIGIKIDDGKACSLKGKLLSGQEIREILMGNSEGVLPMSGPKRQQAEQTIMEFHSLFSSKWTFDTQLLFGVKHFSKQASRRLIFCTTPNYIKHSLCEMLPRIQMIMPSELRFLSFDEACLDLAMCVYWSNSVNAPSYAFKVLCRVMDRTNLAVPYMFSKELLQALGNTTFGRWDDDIVNGRYQRTRFFAKLKWPIELFEGKQAVMPKDMAG